MFMSSCSTIQDIYVEKEKKNSVKDSILSLHIHVYTANNIHCIWKRTVYCPRCACAYEKMQQINIFAIFKICTLKRKWKK